MYLNVLFAALVAFVDPAPTVAPSPAAAVTAPASGADAANFEQGVLAQQAVEFIADPRGCGIALLRSHCRDAFAALGQGKLASVPGLSDYLETGEVSRFPKQLGDVNAIVYPKTQWQADPRSTWLRAAGVVTLASFHPAGNTYVLMQAILLDDMADHATQAAPFAVGMPFQLLHGKSAVDDFGKLGDAIAGQMLQAFPAEAVPSSRTADGDAGVAQLGVLAATANEMFESPLLLFQPSSRRYLHDVSLLVGDTQDAATFLTAKSAAEWKPTIERFQQAVGDKVRSLPEKQKAFFIVGLYSAQAAYNAAVLHETPMRDSAANLLQKAAASNSQNARDLAAKLTSADWHEVDVAATELTRMLMSGTPGP
jgi:hypothetical protein